MTSIAQQFGRDEWTRFTAKQRMTRYAILLTCGLAIAWALTSIEVIWAWVWGAPEQIGDLFGRMYPPDASNLESILKVLWDTVNIATFATAFAVLLSLPVAYISAQNTTPNFGPGVVAGIVAIMFRSIGFIGKLLGEAIEEIDKRPVEALEATGASRFKVIAYAIVPQVMPTFWAVAILRWDINLRESTVLGLVGAGGIGIVLQGAIDTFNWPEVATILIAIIVLVIIGEVISAHLRRRIL
jgi:phosphonate transport system permease protein